MRTSARPRVTLIAAVADNGVIGSRAGGPHRGMLWHLPEDLAFYKRTTTGNTQVMGRATFEAMGGALPGRRTIVVTRRQEWTGARAEVAHSLEEALELAAGGPGETFVAGGGEIFAQAIPVADRLLVTEVHRDVVGDVYFPAIDTGRWRESTRDDRDGFSWVSYERQ